MIFRRRRLPQAEGNTLAPPRLLTTFDQFNARLAAVGGGEVIEYHRGNLTLDRLRHASRLPENDRHELDRVALAARKFADEGRGHLVQRRHGVGDYSYLLIVTNLPAERRVKIAAVVGAP
jgi:hypothetical protein